MLTVGELIARLEGYPRDVRVVINGYEGGVRDLSKAAPIHLMLDVNTERYYGPHEKANNGVPAVWLT